MKLSKHLRIAGVIALALLGIVSSGHAQQDGRWVKHAGSATSGGVDQWTYVHTNIQATLKYKNGMAVEFRVTNGDSKYSIYVSGETGTNQTDTGTGHVGQEVKPGDSIDLPLGYQTKGRPIEIEHFTYEYFDEKKGGAESSVGGTGDIQATLTYRSAYSGHCDVDLHVIDPSGEEISYQHTASKSGGSLDVDDTSGNGTENIFWPVGKAPKGEYQLYVVLFDGQQASWKITLIYGNTRKTFDGVLIGKGSKSSIFRFTAFDPNAKGYTKFNEATGQFEKSTDTAPATPVRKIFNPKTGQFEVAH